MDTASVNELNSLLQGEQMAADSYEKVIQRIQDNTLKNDLQKLQQSHKQHTILLADRIQDLGGTPAKGVGAVGKVSEIVSSVRDINKDAAAILQELYTGEDKGIKMATELVKGDLDGDSAKLVNNILTEDRNNMNILKGVINAVDSQRT